MGVETSSRALKLRFGLTSSSDVRFDGPYFGARDGPKNRNKELSMQVTLYSKAPICFAEWAEGATAPGRMAPRAALFRGSLQEGFDFLARVRHPGHYLQPKSPTF